MVHTFSGIIDVYQHNPYTIQAVKNAGVTAIIHKASEGVAVRDAKYKARKREALEAGLLWGAYHLTSDGPADRQVANFAAMEPGDDPSVLIALDWETAKDGTVPDIAGIRKLVIAFRDRFGRYPVLYGGWTLRDTPEVVLGDPLLGKCPLWYQRYASEPKALPVRTWPTYTLWQFADEHRGFGAPPSTVLPGADFNRFQGTAEQLAAEWPFAREADTSVPAVQPVMTTLVSTGAGVHLRSEPAPGAAVVKFLEKGERVSALSRSDDGRWIEVRSGRKTGFASSRWLLTDVGSAIDGEPAWMPVARAEIGVREVSGPGDNPRIVEYLRSTTLGEPDNKNDETYWCSAFVNWCMEEANIEGTNSAWARDWLAWGKPVTRPFYGCVAVFSRGNGGHVGFFVDRSGGEIQVLGGNQSDAVCIQGYDAGRLLGYRTLG